MRRIFVTSGENMENICKATGLPPALQVITKIAKRYLLVMENDGTFEWSLFAGWRTPIAQKQEVQNVLRMNYKKNNKIKWNA